MALGTEERKKQFKVIFDSLDANKDGGIVWKELEANTGKTDPDKAAQLMEMADKNQDDKITWDEFLDFVEGVMKQEDLSLDKLSNEHMDHFKALFSA